MNNTKEWLMFFSPMIASYAVMSQCNIDKKAGSVVKFRPPAWVFGVVWPMLFLCLGYSFVLTSRTKEFVYFYPALILSLALWSYVYVCKEDKKGGAWVILVSIICAFLCYTIASGVGKLLLCPLIGWLLFALLMNTTEVQFGN